MMGAGGQKRGEKTKECRCHEFGVPRVYMEIAGVKQPRSQ